jgi:hypothetical protein
MRYLKVSVCMAFASCALLGALVRAEPAAAATPCWKALLNDWYDGRIDQTYARHCYLDALHHLPVDVQTYSSAHDDILRAMQGAVARQKKAGHKIGPNTPLVPAGGGKGNGAAGKGGPSGGGNSGGSTTGAAGRKREKGLTGVADKLNPGSASSLPLPLLVLGGLGLALVAAGGVGLAAKRIQARRQLP